MPLTVALTADDPRAAALGALVRELGLTRVPEDAHCDVFIAPAGETAPAGTIGLIGPLPLAAIRACLEALADAGPALDLLRFTDARVDLTRGRLVRDGQMTPLRAKEVALLRALARRAGRPVARADLLAEVWGYGAGVRTRTLDTTVARLRGYLEPDRRQPIHLLTVHGVGYRLELLPPELTVLGQLPATGPPMVGRMAELARVEALFDQGAQWVGLIGLGGVGKSRLALAVARRMAATCPGGTWWIRLTEAGLDSLISAVATTLGMPLVPGVDPVTHVGAVLARRPTTLLVLDGAEGSMDVLGAVLPAWLAAAPDLRVLVTSRRASGVAVERRLPVEPLATDAAERLLAHLLDARGVKPPAAERLAALARCSGGIPLAALLIADQVAQRGATAVLVRLTAEQPETPAADEAAALAVVLQLTWDGLAPAQRTRMVRLAAFVGPLDWQLMLELEDEPAGVPLTDRVQTLHDRGLLALADDVGRRFLVPDPVRRFARRQGDRAAADARHAQLCLARCRRLLTRIDGPTGEAALDSLAPLRPELRAAARRARDAGTALTATLAWSMITVRRGPWTGLPEVIEAALTRWGTTATPGIAAHLLQVRTVAGLVTVQIAAAVADAGRARAVLDALPADATEQASLLLPAVEVRAFVDGCEAQALARVMPARARPYIAAWLARASTPLELGLAMLARGILHGAEMQWSAGASDLGVAADALRRAGRHRHATIAACDRIYYLAQAGELQPALDLAERTEASAHAVLGPILAAFVTQNRALTLLALDRLGEADAAFTRAAARFAELDMTGVRRASLIGRGFVALLDGAPGVADARFSEALARHDRHRGRALAGRALVAALRGDAIACETLARAARAAGGFPAHVVQGAERLVQAAEHLVDPSRPAPESGGLDGLLAQRIIAVATGPARPTAE